jgi:hypothetical protein
MVPSSKQPFIFTCSIKALSITTSARAPPGSMARWNALTASTGEEFYRLLDGAIIDDTNLFNDKLQEWEDYYNYHRPHGGLAGQTPYERLKEKTNSTNPDPVVKDVRQLHMAVAVVSCLIT